MEVIQKELSVIMNIKSRYDKQGKRGAINAYVEKVGHQNLKSVFSNKKQFKEILLTAGFHKSYVYKVLKNINL